MTLLLCYDGSDDAKLAIASAARLSPDRDAIVLHVSKSFVDWSLGPSLGPLLEIPGVDEAILEHAKAVLADGVDVAEQAGFTARGVLRHTGHSIWRTILDVATEEGAGIIVAGSHGRRLRDHLALGSVAQGLVTYATLPLLITHANDVTNDARHDRPKALLAFDGSAAAEVAATELCRLLPAADVAVVSAWDTPGQLGTGLMTDAFVSEIDSLSAELRKEAQRIVERGVGIVRELGPTATATVIASDHGIGQSIVAAARDASADVIALGTQGHNFLTRSLLGSTARYVVQHADRPVLVVPLPTDLQHEQPRARVVHRVKVRQG